MTDTADLSQRRLIAAEKLARIEGELTQAQDDVALLERLSTAQERTKVLSREREAAREEHAATKAAEAAALEELRFAGIVDVRVVDTTPEESVTRSSFHVTYTRLAYDYATQTSVPTASTVVGFLAVPDNILAFLMIKQPDKIPAKIMDLGCGNPATAFDRYFLSLRRGHLAQ